MVSLVAAGVSSIAYGAAEAKTTLVGDVEVFGAVTVLATAGCATGVGAGAEAEAGEAAGTCCTGLVRSMACFFILRISLLIGGASTDGAGAAVGKLATLAAGLAEEEGALGNGLALLDVMLAFDGIVLSDEADDFVGFDASEDGVESVLDCRLWFAFAAASVDLGCRMALAALEALLDLVDLFDELVCGMMTRDGAYTELL